jgi:hypothetical protein
VPECQDGQGQEKSASREIGKSAGWEEKANGEQRLTSGKVTVFGQQCKLTA